MLLSGWKQIAAYMKAGVRTVQRWQNELQLPVVRIRDGVVSPVMAESEKIDLWIRERSSNFHPRVLPQSYRDQEIALRKNATEFAHVEISLGFRFTDLASSSGDRDISVRRVKAARKAYDCAKRTMDKPRLLEKTERQRLLPELRSLQSRLEEFGEEF